MEEIKERRRNFSIPGLRKGKESNVKERDDVKSAKSEASFTEADFRCVCVFSELHFHGHFRNVRQKRMNNKL